MVNATNALWTPYYQYNTPDKLLIDHNEYDTSNVIESVSFFNPGRPILTSTMTIIDDTPVGTQITYYMSADDGDNWEVVTSGSEHTFVNSGNSLKWKAVMESNDVSVTPELSSVIINSNHRVFTYYFMSADGGTNWESVESGVKYTFTNVGKELKYRVVMESADGYHTPRVRNVTLEGPANAVVVYYMSADGGANWEQVASGNQHRFVNSGNSLMWKAQLTSNTTAVIPSIQDVEMSTPANSAIQYYLSNDGGVTWYAAEKGVALTFETAGTTVMWKAE